MRLFWERGYEGTSISDLLEGMGLTKSSLYKAFESKESLFRRVLKRYNRDYLGFRADALAVNVFRQVRDDRGEWTDAPSGEDTAYEIENAILTRARQLRISQLEG